PSFATERKVWAALRRFETLRQQPVASRRGPARSRPARKKSIRDPEPIVKLTRRQFIKATAATGAASVVGGSLLSGCSWFGPKPTQTAGRALITDAQQYGPNLVD